MNLFETKNTISEDTLEELKPHLISPGQKLIAIFGILLSIYCIYLFVLFHSLFFIVCIFASISVIPLSINQNKKIIIKRIQETTNTKECEYTTSFGDEELTVINHSTNGTANICYNNFYRFVETENHYALFTKAEQFVLINKKDIEKAQKKEEFINFVKCRCKNIKSRL